MCGCNGTLDVVHVDVMQVLMLGWIMPVGLRPTCGFDIGPHIGLGLLNSGSQLARAEFRACLEMEPKGYKTDQSYR